MYRPFFVLLLLFCRLIVSAQPSKSYHFTHYGTRNGLLSNRVNDIVQDERGFMWVATVNGLQRFDGHSFINFRHSRNPFSIPADDVADLLLDTKKNLWLVTGDGRAGLFNTSTFRFTEVPVKLRDEKGKPADKKFVMDSKGRIILLFGLLEFVTYSPETNSFAPENNFIPLPPGWRPTEIFENNGKFWITSAGGLAVYNSTNNQLIYPGHDEDKEPAVGVYRDIKHAGGIFIDNRQRLWFISWPPGAGAPLLFAYDLSSNKQLVDRFYLPEVMGSYCEPKKFIQQNDGRLILAGTPFLAEYDERPGKFIRLVNTSPGSRSLQIGNILSIFSDKEQNMWLCTEDDGLYKFNPARQLFQSIPHINPLSGKPGEGAVMSFAALNDNSILAGMWGDGTRRYDNNLNEIPMNIKGMSETYGSIWCMYRRSDGNIWFGMQHSDSNIAVLNPATASLRQYKIFGLKTVRQIVEDRQGNMWIGMHRLGLYKWTPAKAVAKFEDGFSRFDAIDSTEVPELLVDKQGYLWASVNTRGVYKIDPASGEIVAHYSVTSSPAILNNTPGPIIQYSDSIMVIAAGGLTILNTNTNTARYLTTADGLPSPHIRSMIMDKDGMIWAGFMNGLCRISVITGTVTYFDREDGMVNDNFVSDAAYRLADGRLLFGTGRDFIVFDPGRITSKQALPDVTITGFRLSNKELLVDSLLKLKRIHLAYNNNSVSIDFASITYLQQNKAGYSYKLSGVDKDWIMADETQRAVYTHLSPGDYTFMVKAAGQDAASAGNITELRIHVAAPFWRTWWFYSLVALAAGILLFWFDRERMKRKEAVLKMRTDIASSLHEEINTALGNINILSEMAKIKAETEPVKSKEFIEQIRSRSHNMIIAMDDMLWAISPENDSMERTIGRMQEFLDALRNRHHVTIEMLVDERVKSLNLDMQFRHEAFILFKESIRGLIMACATQCKIHLGLEKNQIIYTVQFNNEQCGMRELNDLFHRVDMQKRMDAIMAKLNVEIHKSNSLIELQIPVR